MASERKRNLAGITAFLQDKSSSFHKGLPAETCTYKKSEVRIPLSDSVHLMVDLYEPTKLSGDKTAYGTILVLGCYGRGDVMVLNASIFAARGYIVLFASCRDTFGSEGSFIPGMSEQVDSQDIVLWMRKQSWYSGKFATFGASYLGYTQFALLENPPEDPVASIILCGPHDHARHNWQNNAFRTDRIGWAQMVSLQEEAGMEFGNLSTKLIAAAKNLDVMLKSLPLIDATAQLLNGKATYMQEFMTTPNIDDPFWNSVRHASSLERITSPVYLGSGWYDAFSYQTMEQYSRLNARGCQVDLTIGPWGYTDACGLHTMPEVFHFLGKHLSNQTLGQRPFPVKVYITGDEEWQFLPTWPPPTDSRTFFLRSDKIVSKQGPEGSNLPLSFTYVPAEPTPTIGRPLVRGGGRVDDSIYSSRSDVLNYDSSPICEELKVMEKPILNLMHTADSPYTDIWVRLSEVDTKGVSHNIVETFDNYDKKHDATLVTLELQDCAHVFKKGTKIRIIVAGGSFLLLARNLGTVGNRTMGSEMRSVTHTIHHDGMSKLLLPCSSR